MRIGTENGAFTLVERLIAELDFELGIGDPVQIKEAKRVRKQKTDREDARLLLTLNRFPRVWSPSPENRDLRQRLCHRNRLDKWAPAS